MTPTASITATVRRGPRPDGFVPASALPPLGHFIAGAFDLDLAAERSDVVDPATGEVVVELPLASIDTVDRAVAAARSATREWAATTPRQRADVLLAIADRIDAHADRLKDLESLNTGKPRDVVDDDIASASDVFRFAAGAGRAFSEVGSADYVAGHTSIIVREPVGVVAAIVPWNYPLLMAAWKIAPILAAGNALVIKPAEQTPLSLLALTELIADLLPTGALNVVLGRGRVVGERLSSHDDVDLVAITGSVGSGRAVAAGASGTMKRVHLELGGKAPVLVLADADIALAADGVAQAGFWNAGQECGAATRVLVHDSVAEAFTAALAERVSAIAVGQPWVEGAELGPMISREHFDRVAAFLQRAIADGATPVVGGGAIEGDGFFIAPTVLTGVADGSEASHEEIFGPVVTIETFSDVDEAVRRANEVVYGLAASVWTADAALALSIPRRLDFGTVWVNSHLVIATEAPWGGFKRSGYGRDLSSYSIEDFSRTKHVQIRHDA